MWYISYWLLPLVAACVWLATLIVLLVRWKIDGSPVYATMEPGQSIAYISDIAAQGLKPLFVAGCAVSSVFFVLAFISERWLRHSYRLVPNKGIYDKILSLLSILFAMAGAAGLILLAHFDTVEHSRLHGGFLTMFIGGYLLSAIFICLAYLRLGIHYKEHKIIFASFLVKVFFIVIELALAIAYGVLGKKRRTRDTAAIIEWVIAFIFALYVLSFVVDLFPAVKSKHHIPQGERSQAMAQTSSSLESGSYPSTQPTLNNEAQMATDPMVDVGATYRGRMPAATYNPHTYRQTPLS
ncbi:hypothetical protein MGYG_04740 [Nannizzia gypsea CBS 118893]|uniref:CWH43-like N-terminal domain-containing protein n=1 Tax=Arthroderma gypseum (strain ATCC MYA-4604 / CBS 118893) TaxID=535722 RepID=E4UWI3_ARTGP|nr:hypothetical protein MGYG_04740 [Nannizzia gypsea CBS 118893]EFR01739.1 hypothetical protein MGYG_04740 [Nannizzia gypsea CBS 118893]